MQGAPAPRPGACIVIGAGLAGAAAAAALARRGWQVQVLDAAAQPAAGASALPAGLLAPHASLDDNLLSRLSREGVRHTLAVARALLREGSDWSPTGVVERRLPRPGKTAAAAPRLEASGAQKQAIGLAESDAAWWHADGAWIKPAALVRAWLAQPGIRFRGGVTVGGLRQANGAWELLGADGAVLGAATLVVVAAAGGSTRITRGGVAVQPVRGQVSWGWLDAAPVDWPAVPVNGLGHFLPRVPLEGERHAWLTGSTYARGDEDASVRTSDQEANLERLRQLLPIVGGQLAPGFARGAAQAWAGIRYVSRDRRPLVGELRAGLWVTTAMGSRGLTFAGLCGELLAARLHAEPLPLAPELAAALDLDRG